MALKLLLLVLMMVLFGSGVARWRRAAHGVAAVVASRVARAAPAAGSFGETRGERIAVVRGGGHWIPRRLRRRR